MQENILEGLKNYGPLKTGELSLLVGKRKAKDIQNVLNKLLKRNIIMKSKVNTKLQWSLVEHSGNTDEDLAIKENIIGNENVSVSLLNGHEIVVDNIVPINKEIDPDCSNVNFDNHSESYMEIINMNLKDEIKFLHKEIDGKNDLINSQQRIIDILVTDQHQQKKQQNIYNEEYAMKQIHKQEKMQEQINEQQQVKVRQEKIHQEKIQQEKQYLQEIQRQYKEKQQLHQDRQTKLQQEIQDEIQQEKRGELQQQRQQHLILNEENSSVSSVSEEEISNYDEDGFYLKHKKKRRSRPDIVTTNNPEKQHFDNNHKNIENARKVNSNTGNNKKPFILVVGDSMTKNINSFELRQKCKGTHFMVRTLRGGKIKNIKNLIIDTLEDCINKPDALCIHVSSNDIGNGRSIDDIEKDFENLINLVKRQDIQPIVSMVIIRKDKYANKVEEVNYRLRNLCIKYNLGYIDNTNIKIEHLNAGGIHISNSFNYLFADNLSNYFNFVVQNEF